MKLKVGDEVRLTREGMRRMSAEGAYIDDIFVDGSMIKRIKDELVCVKGTNKLIHESHFELVPENPEFEYGEEIEVTNDGDNWFKRIFITKSKECRYVCVDHTCYSAFKNGRQYTVAFYDSARKLPQQLTRKEIANHFGVDVNFVLIDDVNTDEV